MKIIRFKWQKKRKTVEVVKSGMDTAALGANRGYSGIRTSFRRFWKQNDRI